MQIDWITFAAQLVNFLILIWLLKRFLYGPITAAMARREQRISDRLDEARSAREKAEEEERSLREEREDLEARRDEILAEARQEARALRDELEEKAREEVDETRRAWLGQVEHERREIVQGLQERVYRFVLETVRRLLRDFADADLATQTAREFARRLESLDEDARARLARAAGGADGPLSVESGLDLPEDARARIAEAVRSTVSEDAEIRFETDPELLIGVRLAVGDQTVRWSGDRHLDRLEDSVREALEARSGTARETRAGGAAEA